MLLELMLLELELVPVLLVVLLVLVLVLVLVVLLLVLVLVPGCGKDEKVAIPDGLSGLSGLLFVGVCGRFRASSAIIGPVSMEQKAHHESVYYLVNPHIKRAQLRGKILISRYE
jgi:hypothetical protein